MEIKQKFELIYNTKGDIFNVVPLSESTLSAYKIKSKDREFLISQVKSYSRVRPHPISKLVDRSMDKIAILNFELYPLPGFVTTGKVGAVNLSVLPQKYITDYNPSDIYAMFVYTTALKRYIAKKPFSQDNAMSIALMIFSLFMNMFGKSSGLIGSYAGLIPKLQFLIALYVNASFMGVKVTDELKQKIAADFYFDYNSIDLNYDFTSIKGLLNAINKNEIIPISENVFSTKMIGKFGITSLPMVEDCSRWYATILASTVSGNSIFPAFLSKINTGLFQKHLYIAIQNLK